MFISNHVHSLLITERIESTTLRDLCDDHIPFFNVSRNNVRDIYYFCLMFRPRGSIDEAKLYLLEEQKLHRTNVEVAVLYNGLEIHAFKCYPGYFYKF